MLDSEDLKNGERLICGVGTYASSYSNLPTIICQSFLSSTSTFTKIHLIMPGTTVELTAPNGLQIDQPIGLFINNEFVKSSSGEKFATINPTYVKTPKSPQLSIAI